MPAYAVAAQVTERLSREGSLVVCAPPGAGKSTVLPFAVLDAVPQGEKVLMLEPRRIAARQVAERMAFLAREKPGGAVGYRMRFESRVSSATRIEVLTEGVLGRMIVDDPTLDGVGAVIFDEFHERSLAADEALALVRETRSVLRPDLKLVIIPPLSMRGRSARASEPVWWKAGDGCFRWRSSIRGRRLMSGMPPRLSLR